MHKLELIAVIPWKLPINLAWQVPLQEIREMAKISSLALAKKKNFGREFWEHS